MTAREKAMHWTRWSIVVKGDEEPGSIGSTLRRSTHKAERFSVTEVSPVNEETGEVSMVVEYTARGANRNDIMRRLKAMGLTDDQVELTQQATVNIDEPANAELARAFGIEVTSAEADAETSDEEVEV